ncbi:esterase/lipase family protein [Catenuloplanes japonicus]|uniref:esterase/lipase family protein n=1 Tax=Catenuloplanes japonicus TaxID=33876 RepID=UPI000526B4C2|nr:alpha/beta fold hydrolase [Catenuloplanes japonicus]
MRPKLAAALLAFLAILTGTAAPAHAAARREPVVLIHGYNSTPATWNKLVGRLKAAGYDAADIHPFGYNYRVSNVTTAALLDSYISKIGADRVDIVAHSMGALVARYYVKNLGGAAHVDDLISLAGPHHGTRVLTICSFDPSCREMLPGSAFLRALNAGDETPGALGWRTFYSKCDLLVLPYTSALLDGAENTDAGCLGHTEFRLVDSIGEQVIKALKD